MTDMTTSNPAPSRNRDAKGTTTGGQFAAEQKPEAAVSLPGPEPRSAFGGYEMRAFRSAGQGMEGKIWSAKLYRDGKAVIAITDTADGGPCRYIDLVSGAAHVGGVIDTFRAQATAAMPQYAEYADDVFAEFLLLSSQMDKNARDNRISKQEAYDIHLEAGVLSAEEHEMLSNPDSITRID